MSFSLKSGATSGGVGRALLVHGGAWDIPDDVLDEHRDGLLVALSRGRALLEDGATALDVVTAVVAVLESHGAFDAGCGSVLNQEGVAELDAGLMAGHTLGFGSVASVRRVANPILLARRLLDRGEGQVRLLVGDGAERFAASEGIALVENGALICERERERYGVLKREAERFHTSHAFLPAARQAPRGTVGCVARDVKGRLAAATSTGGTPFHPPGRVGDSPLPGAGFYADAHGAASATGWGEAIATVLLSGRVIDRIATGERPEAVARERLSAMHSAVKNREGEGATGGLILLDALGRGGWAYTTPRMARAGWAEGEPEWVGI